MTKTAQRRERAFARTREDILLAAARAFGRSGFGLATMQDIAREAGFTAASLYTYFTSKHEILRALIELIGVEFRRVFGEDIPAGFSFEQKVEIVLRRQIDVIERRRDIFQLFFNLPPVEGLCKDGRPYHHPFEARVAVSADWLRENATAADLGGHDPLDVARFFLGTAMTFVHAWALDGMSGRLVDRVPLMLDLIFHGVSGARSAAGAKRR